MVENQKNEDTELITQAAVNNNSDNQEKKSKSRLFLKTAAYSAVAASALVVAAPVGLAGYAYLRTTEVALNATKWAFDNPIKSLVGGVAAAGMYYAANNIDWDSIEEKVTQNATTVTQNYQEQKINTLEKTLDELQIYTGSLEEQNTLLKQGGSVMYEQYDPKLLMGIGVGSAALGGLVGGFAGYSMRKTKPKMVRSQKSRNLTQV